MGIYPHFFSFVKGKLGLVNNERSERVLQILSLKIKSAREAAGLSKNELSKMTGLDRSTLRFVEDPTENPTILTLIRISLALNFDLGKALSESFAEEQEAKNEEENP